MRSQMYVDIYFTSSFLRLHTGSLSTSNSCFEPPIAMFVVSLLKAQTKDILLAHMKVSPCEVCHMIHKSQHSIWVYWSF